MPSASKEEPEDDVGVEDIDGGLHLPLEGAEAKGLIGRDLAANTTSRRRW
jgi:hypothetical protein